MFIIDLVPLVHGDLSNNQELRAIRARWATRAHLGVAPALAFPLPRHLPMGESMKHTSKPYAPLIPCQCKIKGHKSTSHGLLTCHGITWCANGPSGVVPTI
jgi:hypothetical protein